MPASRPAVVQSRRRLRLVKKAEPLAFDAGLDQACRLAADDVARELGRQAAREVIESMKAQRKLTEAS